jgi:hypothetical protein
MPSQSLSTDSLVERRVATTTVLSANQGMKNETEKTKPLKGYFQRKYNGLDFNTLCQDCLKTYK